MSRALAGVAKTGRTNYNIRINARILAKHLCKAKTGDSKLTEDCTRIVAGSKPPPVKGAIWNHWQSAGFKVS